MRTPGPQPGAPHTLPAAQGPQSCRAGAGFLGEAGEPHAQAAQAPRCQSSVGGTSAGTLPCPPRPSLGGGTYLRRLSRPCLLEFLLRSAELLMVRPPAWPATWPDPSPGGRDGTLRLLLQRLLPAALCGCPAPSTPPATGTLSPLSLSFPLSLLLALSLPLAGWLVSGSDTPSPASPLCLLVCDPPPVCPGPSGPWGSPGPAPHWLPPGCPSAPLSLSLRPLSRSRTPSSCFPLVPPSPLPRPPRSSPPPPPPPSETSKNVREKTLAAQQPGGLAGPQRPVMGRR